MIAYELRQTTLHATTLTLILASTELKKLATWVRAYKMTIIIGKTFQNKGKNSELNGQEPNADGPRLIIPIQRCHNNHPNPNWHTL
jgi:hypothetical protein